ncbi:MAG TPA: peptide deformylase, partial [Candidatus Limnocylindrales bacterium]|nr:peptide deformylase [Candidatus Limnocylindrales bacterium]
GSVDRHEQVLIKGLDRHGKPTRVKAKGWLARVFQHEIDHLDGQLYIDIASDVWKAKDSDGEELSEAEEHAERNAD